MISIWKRRADILLLTALAAARPAAAAVKAPSPGPNIVLVVLDAARADHFSAAGYPAATTPRMDGLARRGAWFERAFSPATNTYAALPRLFSSRYIARPLIQPDGGRWGMREALPEDVNLRDDDQLVSLPKLLAASGLRTALFTDHYALAPDSDLGRQFQEAHCSPRPREHSDERMFSQAAAWLRENAGRRFFLYLHVMSPHGDYPERDTDPEFLSGRSPAQVAALRRKLSDFPLLDSGVWSPEDLRILRGLYDSGLKHADRQVGALYDTLAELGLDRRTVFAVTADHGEHLGEHGRLTHGPPAWDTVLHVPLILVYPPRVRAGVRVRGLTGTMDITPTILDLAGILLPPGKVMAGSSLLPALRHPERGPAQVLGEEYIRTERHKYLVREDLLYDLDADPGEEKDIARGRPDLRESLRGEHERILAPHLARYRGARTAKPPEEPFYITVSDLDLAPRESLARYKVLPGTHTLRAAEPAALPWLLGAHRLAPGLMRHPAVSTAPAMVLSCPLPAGDYRVAILMKSLDAGPPGPDRLGLRFRFQPEEPFRPPLGFAPVLRKRVDGRPGDFAYLDLGRAAVARGGFRLELEIPAPPERPYLLRQIRFEPAGAAPAARPGAERQHQIEELLKASGYLSQ